MLELRNFTKLAYLYKLVPVINNYRPRHKWRRCVEKTLNGFKSNVMYLLYIVFQVDYVYTKTLIKQLTNFQLHDVMGMVIC